MATNAKQQAISVSSAIRNVLTSFGKANDVSTSELRALRKSMNSQILDLLKSRRGANLERKAARLEERIASAQAALAKLRNRNSRKK